MRTPFRDAFDGHLGQIATRDGPALRTALIDPGTDDNDTLSAGPGFDLLLGFGGEDRLVAGQNLDILIGGADADSYVFAPSSTGFKIVLGFEEGVDTLDLSAFTDIHDLRQIDFIEDTWGTLIRLDETTIFMPDGYITLTDETTVLLSPDPVITFDDIGPIENGDGSAFLPPNDLWRITSGTRYFDKTIVDNEEGGWITASGDYAAIVAAEVLINRKDVLATLPFDFKSVSLAALNRIDLRIDITARDDEGVTLATDTLMVSQGSYTDYVADPALFDDIATLEFRSSGGTPVDPELGDTRAFLMDDLLLV